MPVAVAPMARKETADALIVFANGTVRSCGLEDGYALRNARKEAIEFKAFTRNAATE